MRPVMPLTGPVPISAQPGWLSKVQPDGSVQGVVDRLVREGKGRLPTPPARRAVHRAEGAGAVPPAAWRSRPRRPRRCSCGQLAAANQEVEPHSVRAFLVVLEELVGDRIGQVSPEDALGEIFVRHQAQGRHAIGPVGRPCRDLWMAAVRHTGPRGDICGSPNVALHQPGRGRSGLELPRCSISTRASIRTTRPGSSSARPATGATSLPFSPLSSSTGMIPAAGAASLTRRTGPTTSGSGTGLALEPRCGGSDGAFRRVDSMPSVLRERIDARDGQPVRMGTRLHLGCLSQVDGDAMTARHCSGGMPRGGARPLRRVAR